MALVVAPHSTAFAVGRRIRVMLVDDAIVVRGLFARWVEAEPDLELVASLRSGREAVNQIERVAPDVVVLDVEMPDMDGITALPQLLAKKRDVVVIMASTVTRRNAEVSLRALALGAADYIPKPATSREINVGADFHRDLIEKIRQLGLRTLRRRSILAAPAPCAATIAPPLQPSAHAHADIALRPMPLTPPRALLIGSSTGGPQALNAVLTQAGPVLDRAPVLVTQHMPPTFTAILAEHLTRAIKHPVREAVDGEAVQAGTVYLAPGGRHMSVVHRDNAIVIALDDGPLINFCKPSVDPLFTSAAAVWGTKALALVLTGMGHDGLAGAKQVVAAGGHVVAQDEASSVVWGMPGQVAMAGLCSAVLPLTDIGPKLARLFAGERA
ncbi:chemotaxis response regulator protein-glutamate methylesterase [Pseudolabrys taiwanensis]|uniref:Protein-glutamate methylesterase/protein-glutamine glutaminase n=1 Tax=Pseudolabrys taiwanensis TaxID=331696 RepID=A0A345ZW79_9HYPH|nr:chemotaxis response regulator protein-glutamate methylesterase [Pseudolabrys taiwanensis]AXK81176.1 chemotaxis response regulator protein-glutamate methylesterase [Pseudolabrys taiwanensis]